MEQYDYITACVLQFRFQKTEHNQYSNVTSDICCMLKKIPERIDLNGSYSHFGERTKSARPNYSEDILTI